MGLAHHKLKEISLHSVGFFVNCLLHISGERLQKSYVKVGVKALLEPSLYMCTIVLLYNSLVIAPNIVVKQLAINYKLNVLRVILELLALSFRTLLESEMPIIASPDRGAGTR
ncbi:hypothetical protein CC86DRAFT_388814 [Ophiobolus disseminans]|uniref:Uncharacterized protein n=1 Tax=Ophiobolus disseminans TaxID=1469910 RepID=A0A6A6ZCR2_9PLEO|nr:hypothetical protein CC86DRAFT_388814 [Ophiobolus disseminans]